MRIRSIKPEFWRSPDISALSWHDRLLFIGLWSYVDDNGVGEDRLSMIAADLFADDLSRDSRDTLARVADGLERLSAGGRIVRYEVDGRDYLEITNWAKHQRIDRPNKPRYPRHDAENAVIRDTLATLSRQSSGWNRGTEEQGNRGTGEQFSSSEVADATRPEIDHLLDLLDDLIEANGSKRPTRNKKNWDAARLMLDRDGRTVEQIEYLIRWSQEDEFWRGNILSMAKLRDKFDQLRLKAAPVRHTSRAADAMQLAHHYEAQEQQESKELTC